MIQEMQYGDIVLHKGQITQVIQKCGTDDYRLLSGVWCKKDDIELVDITKLTITYKRKKYQLKDVKILKI